MGEVEFVGGKPFRVHGTFQDINTSKIDRIELEKSKAKLNMALNTAGVGNWIYFPKEDRLVWGDTMYSIYGRPADTPARHFEDWVSCLHPSDKDGAIDNFQESLVKMAETFEGQFRIQHPEKGKRTIRAKAFIEYDELGEAIEINGLNWDVSQEVSYQETLIKARKNAQDATQAKSAFLASMSHEIRTPMNGMMGMLELLAESQLNEKQEELVEVIQDCGDQLLSIVNDILDFSKIEAGKLELEYRHFDPRKVMKGVISIFDAQANRKGITLNCFIDNSIPNFLLGDETRLKQILTNLVSNAMKFTDSGSITLDLVQDKKRSSNNQGIFIFKVRDTGIGIPLDKQNRLFQSFRQVDESTTREFGGTGFRACYLPLSC